MYYYSPSLLSRSRFSSQDDSLVFITALDHCLYYSECVSYSEQISLPHPPLIAKSPFLSDTCTHKSPGLRYVSLSAQELSIVLFSSYPLMLRIVSSLYPLAEPLGAINRFIQCVSLDSPSQVRFSLSVGSLPCPCPISLSSQ